LIKYCVISVFSLISIYSLTFLLYADPAVTTVTFEHLIKSLFSELMDNLLFVSIQIIVLSLQIILVGGYIGELLINKKKGRFVVGSLTFLTVWILLFLNCSLTAGIINAFQYSWSGFSSAFILWVIYGFLPFSFLGIIHGLTTGYFLGNSIQKQLYS
jgi:hypothetical protein